MKELLKRFIDKECIITSFGGNQYLGIIKEVTDGAILIEKNEKAELLNLDFVTCIKENTKKKKHRV